MAENKVNFGFKQVDEAVKSGLVRDVFNNVANKYDLMNDLMSAGLHRWWKKEMINEVKAVDGNSLLDLAAGSGDISFGIIKSLKNKNIDVSCVTSDINEEMLGIAKKRSIDENIVKNIEFKIIDGENIPYPENSFDFVTIAFGIRNVTNIAKALSEIFRVLKPGGKFVCLEFSDVNNETLRKIYDAYSFNIIPKIGKFVANDEESYKYLVESIKLFPSADNFQKMIDEAGFAQSRYKKLTGGVVAIHTGFKA
jgi:demethylmenaquinone methyltransferase / 2-methoxy-6-polyprenyl-1,4-benzoquinol methylase